MKSDILVSQDITRSNDIVTNIVCITFRILQKSLTRVKNAANYLLGKKLSP